MGEPGHAQACPTGWVAMAPVNYVGKCLIKINSVWFLAIKYTRRTCCKLFVSFMG